MNWIAWIVIGFLAFAVCSVILAALEIGIIDVGRERGWWK